MTRGYARRLGEIDPFRVMKLLARANALEEQGHDVVHMEVGEPDFATPAPIVRAGLAALADGRTRYTPASGIHELREAIARHYEERFGVSVDPARIFVTAGASGALLLVSALLLNQGEGLLMTDPGYPCNRHFLKAFHGEGQLVPVGAGEHYQLTAEAVRRHWEGNTRGVMLASPANPTGAMVARAELSAVIEEVRSRNGHVVVDEIYQGLTYGEAGPVSVLQVAGDAFVLNSFSKYFGMTGWRLGWLVAPADAAEELEKLAQNLFICPSSIAQYAALAAFGPEAREIMERQRRIFAQRRDFLIPGLKELGFVIPLVPEGAFYVYAQLPEGSAPSETFCERVLEEQKVAITPGTDFGFHRADDHVRFTYAEDRARLALALERIGRALGRDTRDA